MSRAIVLPPFNEIAGNTFATVDAYLQFQRGAVAAARRILDADADTAWRRLPEDGCARFLSALGEAAADQGELPMWRRAWWLWAIGGRPRAPFEIATSPELAQGLTAALCAPLAPASPPDDRAALFEEWWCGIVGAVREQITQYAANRVAAAWRRLSEEGLAPPGGEDAVEPSLIDDAIRAGFSAGIGAGRAGRRRWRSPSRAELARVRRAEERALAAHRSLDARFARLESLCAACTRETGGCCSLTVPLLWREADYRLLAMGGVTVPRPNEDAPAACPFLGAAGCRLPSERRPHICRSFLCERAEQALGDELASAQRDIAELTTARSQLGP